MKTHRVRTALIRSCATIVVLGFLAACQSVLGPKRVVQLLEIAPAKLPCNGIAPQECMQVRESGETDWEYFYDGIEGFTFEAGFTYLLRVERTTVRNPPADGSSYRWRLLELISKTPAS